MFFYIFIAVCVIIFIGCIIRINKQNYLVDEEEKAHERDIIKACSFGILITGLILGPVVYLTLYKLYRKFMKYLNSQNKYNKYNN